MGKNLCLIVIMLALSDATTAAASSAVVRDREAFLHHPPLDGTLTIKGQQVDQEFVIKLEAFLESNPAIHSLTFDHCTFYPLPMLEMHDFSYLSKPQLTSFAMHNCGLTVAMADEVCRSLENTVKSIDFSNGASGSNPNVIDTSTREYQTLLELYFNGNKFSIGAPIIGDKPISPAELLRTPPRLSADSAPSAPVTEPHHVPATEPRYSAGPSQQSVGQEHTNVSKKLDFD